MEGRPPGLVRNTSYPITLCSGMRAQRTATPVGDGLASTWLTIMAVRRVGSLPSNSFVGSGSLRNSAPPPGCGGCQDFRLDQSSYPFKTLIQPSPLTSARMVTDGSEAGRAHESVPKLGCSHVQSTGQLRFHTR